MHLTEINWTFFSLHLSAVYKFVRETATPLRRVAHFTTRPPITLCVHSTLSVRRIIARSLSTVDDPLASVRCHRERETERERERARHPPPPPISPLFPHNNLDHFILAVWGGEEECCSVGWLESRYTGGVRGGIEEKGGRGCIQKRGGRGGRGDDGWRKGGGGRYIPSFLSPLLW